MKNRIVSITIRHGTHTPLLVRAFELSEGDACINIKTGHGTRWHTVTEKEQIAELPYWGKAEDLMKELS